MQHYIHGKTTWEPLTQERLRMSLHTTVKEKKYTEPIAIDSATEKDESSLKPEALAEKIR